MTNHETFMREAARLALENVTSGAGGPFGAVIVRDGEIVARGVNRVTALNDPTAHAEIVAIRDATAKLGRFDLSDCVIYTSCEPCPMCLGAVYWARLSGMYYGCTKDDADAIGFSDAFIYRELEKPISARTLPTAQLGREDAIKAFEAWAASTTKLEY